MVFCRRITNLASNVAVLDTMQKETLSQIGEEMEF